MGKPAAFTAKETPNGKWHLFKGDTSMGFFETPAECASAIHRIVVPNVLYWNADGEPIE